MVAGIFDDRQPNCRSRRLYVISVKAERRELLYKYGFGRIDACRLHPRTRLCNSVLVVSQLQRVLQFQRVLRHTDGTQRRGRQPVVDHVGQVAVQVTETVHRIRGAHRPEPQSPRVQDNRGQIAVAHDTVHAFAHQRLDDDIHGKRARDRPSSYRPNGLRPKHIRQRGRSLLSYHLEPSDRISRGISRRSIPNVISRFR